ncbi:MAG TPA: hypothetical protein VD834_16265, partial [Blastococcus sp.]|nr:hypothetical protein [Blastococcus sp.]
MSSSRSSSASSQVAGFGTNEWLVEEMYQQYLADPSSVDQAWHEFFADYRPGSPVGGADREPAAPTGSKPDGPAPAPAPAAAAPATPSTPAGPP